VRRDSRTVKQAQSTRSPHRRSVRLSRRTISPGAAVAGAFNRKPSCLHASLGIRLRRPGPASSSAGPAGKDVPASGIKWVTSVGSTQVWGVRNKIRCLERVPVRPEPEQRGWSSQRFGQI